MHPDAKVMVTEILLKYIAEGGNRGWIFFSASSIIDASVQAQVGPTLFMPLLPEVWHK